MKAYGFRALFWSEGIETSIPPRALMELMCFHVFSIIPERGGGFLFMFNLKSK